MMFLKTGFPMKFLCLSCACLILSSLHTETPFMIFADYTGTNTPYDYSEFMEIKVPESEARDKWTQVTREISEDGISSFEWIPKTEKLDARTEIITIHFMAKRLKDAKPSTAKQIVVNIFKQSSQQYPDMQWVTIQDDENDFIYEWSLPYGSDIVPQQDEIVRIVSTDKGFHRIAYEKRVPKMDEHTRQLWINRLGSSRLYTKTPPIAAE